MQDRCSEHPSFLEVYSRKDHMGVAIEIGILCAKCGTSKRVWPEEKKAYYCRFCGHHTLVRSGGCSKCGSSVGLRRA